MAGKKKEKRMRTNFLRDQAEFRWKQRYDVRTSRENIAMGKKVGNKKKEAKKERERYQKCGEVRKAPPGHRRGSTHVSKRGIVRLKPTKEKSQKVGLN